jgi:hypothetical protein
VARHDLLAAGLQEDGARHQEIGGDPDDDERVVELIGEANASCGDPDVPGLSATGR